MFKHYAPATLFLVALSLACIFFSLSTGSVSVSFIDTFKALMHSNSIDETSSEIIQNIRLPRVLSAFAIGGLLALSGVLMQVLLRNPLADPYIMGISGGAALGALIGLYFNLGATLGYLLASAGALISIALVFIIARGESQWSSNKLLLTGIVLAAGWGALITLILSISPAKPLKNMLYWLMGDLSFAHSFLPALLLLLCATVFCFFIARPMNILAQGDTDAKLLGLDVPLLRKIIFILAAMLTTTAVILGGTIGFVGLIIPHILRLWKTGDHRWLVPASVLAGGSLLCIADTAARTLIAPQQLPVGAIMALIGVPLFLYLIRR